MNIRTVGATAGVGLLVALSTALPATARGGPQTSLEEMLPVLATSQGPSDRIPAAVDLAELGNPSPSSTRFLGSDGTADYWVARIGGSQVCLILYVPTAEMAGSSCGDIADFYRSGIGMIAGATDDEGTSLSTEGYLLPADVNSAALRAADVSVANRSTRLGSQDSTGRGTEARQAARDTRFVTVDPQGRELESFTVERGDGSTFRFQPMSRRN